jgi:hypothetical protein
VLPTPDHEGKVVIPQCGKPDLAFMGKCLESEYEYGNHGCGLYQTASGKFVVVRQTASVEGSDPRGGTRYKSEYQAEICQSIEEAANFLIRYKAGKAILKKRGISTVTLIE